MIEGSQACKLTPLGQGGGALEFEVLAVVKMTFPVEMISGSEAWAAATSAGF